MPTSPVPHPRRRVALLIETSVASARDMVRGVARYVRGHAAWSITHEPAGASAQLPAWVRQRRGDGLIVRLQNQAMADAVKKLGIPAVDVLGQAAASDVPLVHVDNAAIGRLAASHFVHRGFCHFGFVGWRGIVWSEERERSFVESVRPFATSVAVFTRRHSRNPSEIDTEHLAEWLHALPKPAAVMAAHDRRGRHVLAACRQAEILVPEQIAVLAVDNDEPVCEVSDPPLSSIDAGHVDVGFRAAELLDRLMAGEAPPPEPIFVPPSRLINRRSSDMTPVDDPDVQQALRFIRDHACAGIQINDVAAAVQLSRSTLQRRFQSSVRRSVHDEILQTRLHRAQELLAQTDLPLDEVAERTGFKHQEYLGAVFREKLNQTPRAYRLAHQEGR